MLDDDLYKLTMCQAVCQCYPHAQAIYNFTNRGNTKFPKGFINRLKEEIEMMGDLHLTYDEAAWLQVACPFLTPVFIDFLRGYQYNYKDVNATCMPDGRLWVMIKGPWYRTILWEVKLMAVISELYFRMTAKADEDSIQEAVVRTAMKAQDLTKAGIAYADFGTRRRFSAKHHAGIVHVHSITAPDNFVGTSNLHLAQEYATKPIGTQAHEWFMFHGAKYGYQEANHMALKHWVDVYHGNLGITLPDTFTSRSFFRVFGSKYAKLFDGVRHDSGDPFAFAHRVKDHYIELGISPESKTIVFSDSLSPLVATKLKKECDNIGIKCSFGIGTNLTNDIKGVKPLNMVIKMSHCKPYGESKWLPVVKLSDTEGKHTGTEEEIALCKKSLRIS
jgi:nicotinate phosphoribosyltransferase